MMGLLLDNVVPHVCDLREADGEDAVAVLPPKSRSVGSRPLIQSDEPRFTSLTISAGGQVRARTESRWT